MAQTTEKTATTPSSALTARASASPRSRIRRHPERSMPEIAEEILRAGRVAHVAFAVDGQPYIIPMTYYYEDSVVYLHGAPPAGCRRRWARGRRWPSR
jgi:hypothetical protein